MRTRRWEGITVGLLVWGAGTLVVAWASRYTFFATAVAPAALLAFALMYGLTRWHLRSVPPAQRAARAIEFGVLVTAVQFPLDAMAFYAMNRWGFLPMSIAAREMLVIGLEVGYLGLLLTPYLVATLGPKDRD